MIIFAWRNRCAAWNPVARSNSSSRRRRADEPISPFPLFRLSRRRSPTIEACSPRWSREYLPGARVYAARRIANAVTDVVIQQVVRVHRRRRRRRRMPRLVKGELKGNSRKRARRRDLLSPAHPPFRSPSLTLAPSKPSHDLALSRDVIRFDLFELFLRQCRTATFLDGFHRGGSRVFSFALVVFASSRVVSFFPFLFFFIASPSPVPGNISQLRGFMGHHKDTRCVSVAWWPTRVNFYYGRERLIRARTTRETYSSSRSPQGGRAYATKNRRCLASPSYTSPRHEKFRLPGRPLHYLHSETAASLTNCHYILVDPPASRRDYSPFCCQRTVRTTALPRFPSKNLGWDVLPWLNLRHTRNTVLAL